MKPFGIVQSSPKSETADPIPVLQPSMARAPKLRKKTPRVKRPGRFDYVHYDPKVDK